MKAGSSSSPGTLILIGGREDKTGEMRILKRVAEMVGKGKLCIATVASASAGDELWNTYRRAFQKLGLRNITHLCVVHRDREIDRRAFRAVRNASGVFFTGGDQLKITSEIGGTLVGQEIERIFLNGGVVAGTSAGASVMSETMLMAGLGVRTYRMGSGLRMAPGLGFVRNVVIDQHFAERGRIGRLVAAVAHNPRYLGIGLDEDTAIIVKPNETFEVVGDGGVYVLDAHESMYSNISEAKIDDTLSISNVKFHLLKEGDQFDMRSREIIPESERAPKARSFKAGRGYDRTFCLH